MTTCGELIDEVRSLLQGPAATEQFSTLAADLGPTDLSLTVTDVQSQTLGVAPGIVEIGQELIYTATVSSQDATLTVPPWGRGYSHTVPAAHAAGVQITSTPTFPRREVLTKINDVIARVFPEVYAVRTVELATTVPSSRYTLPGDAQWLLDARWQEASAEKYWNAVDRWRMAPVGGTGPSFATVAVDLYDWIPPGRPLLLTYAAAPAALSAEDEVFEDVTGLGVGMRDVLVIGAAARLAQGQELGRLQLSSIEQQDRSRLVAPSAALTSSRFLEQQFQARLMEERRALQVKYPIRLERQ